MTKSKGLMHAGESSNLNYLDQVLAYCDQHELLDNAIRLRFVEESERQFPRLQKILGYRQVDITRTLTIAERVKAITSIGLEIASENNIRAGAQVLLHEGVEHAFATALRKIRAIAQVFERMLQRCVLHTLDTHMGAHTVVTRLDEHALHHLERIIPSKTATNNSLGTIRFLRHRALVNKLTTAHHLQALYEQVNEYHNHQEFLIQWLPWKQILEENDLTQAGITPADILPIQPDVTDILTHCDKDVGMFLNALAINLHVYQKASFVLPFELVEDRLSEFTRKDFYQSAEMNVMLYFSERRVPDEALSAIQASLNRSLHTFLQLIKDKQLPDGSWRITAVAWSKYVATPISQLALLKENISILAEAKERPDEESVGVHELQLLINEVYDDKDEQELLKLLNWESVQSDSDVRMLVDMFGTRAVIDNIPISLRLQSLILEFDWAQNERDIVEKYLISACKRLPAGWEKLLDENHITAWAKWINERMYNVLPVSFAFWSMVRTSWEEDIGAMHIVKRTRQRYIGRILKHADEEFWEKIREMVALDDLLGNATKKQKVLLEQKYYESS